MTNLNKNTYTIGKQKSTYKWRSDNHEKYNELQRKYNLDSYYKKHYGMTKQEYLDDTIIKSIRKLFI